EGAVTKLFDFGALVNLLPGKDGLLHISQIAHERVEKVSDYLQEGQIVDGVVKNITDYGAFVDLGGIDGLLHVTDIAWRRINHPSEVLNI
ncbi:S1 RNA-binding domain-containing protein, partial [Acinetobacter baumannii]